MGACSSHHHAEVPEDMCGDSTTVLIDPECTVIRPPSQGVTVPHYAQLRANFLLGIDHEDRYRLLETLRAANEISLVYTRAQAGTPIKYKVTGWPVRRGGAVSAYVLHETAVSELSGSATPLTVSATPAEKTFVASNQTAQDKLMRYAINELLNAMHALSASAYSVMESLVDVNPDTRQDLQDIGFAAQNTQVLVNDILTMNKLKEGALVSTPELISIGLALHEVAAHVRPVAKSPIIVSVCPSLPTYLNVDMSSISSLLLNALVLAAKYTTLGGEPIHIVAFRERDTAQTVGSAQGRIVIEVLDCSSVGLGGMTAQQLTDILVAPEERTIRGARAQRMALFLPIAKMLLEPLNGYVAAEDVKATTASGMPTSVTRFALSTVYTEPTDAEARRIRDELEATRSGLRDEDRSVNTAKLPAPFCFATKAPTFRDDASSYSAVTLPSNQTPLKTSVDRIPSTDEARSNTRRRKPITVTGLDGVPLAMNVLLVDDSGVIRRQGENFLEQLGCTCLCLEDGDQVQHALEASARPFDAILMDIVMHRSDGAQVCQDLRGRLGVKCPIIAMTGNTKSTDMQRYYAMGFDVVLPKPFTRESLGRVLVEGRERRGGNTRFARMPAHGLPLPSEGVTDSTAKDSSRYPKEVSASAAESTPDAVVSDLHGSASATSVHLQMPGAVNMSMYQS